ncbi:MAG TPA: class I SAM-dependent methyltransferase [Solirubrobacterales bacterium]|nr:class I SAM-dependent methyltransferase [Solirubrobacterales bacterium]
MLERYFPPEPAVVADVGGGPGTYAVPIAARGNAVHLLDPVPGHLRQALEAAEGHTGAQLAGAVLGDARELPWADGQMDAVVLFGPLYHLVTEEGRLQALREARRVLSPGGRLFAMAMSRFVYLRDAIQKRSLVNPRVRLLVKNGVESGQHRNPDCDPQLFTTAYLHRPEEFAVELATAGFEVEQLISVEGPAGRMADLDWWLEVPERREALLDGIREVEMEPSLLGASPQILAVARS